MTRGERGLIKSHYLLLIIIIISVVGGFMGAKKNMGAKNI